MPYKGTLTFIPSYQFYIRKMFESGYVKKITCKVVYTGDDFKYVEGSNESISHASFRGPRKDRGERLAVYCITKNKYGEEEITVLWAEDVEGIRAKSQAAKSDFSPWNSKIPLELDWMWMKSAIRQRHKMIPDMQNIADDDDVIDVDFKGPGIGIDPNAIVGDGSASMTPAVVVGGETVNPITGEVKAMPNV